MSSMVLAWSTRIERGGHEGDQPKAGTVNAFGSPDAGHVVGEQPVD